MIDSEQFIVKRGRDIMHSNLESPAYRLHELSLGFATKLREQGVCNQLIVVREGRFVEVLADAQITYGDYSYHKAVTPEVRQIRDEYEKACLELGARLRVFIGSSGRFAEVLKRARDNGEDYVHYVLAQDQLGTFDSNST